MVLSYEFMIFIEVISGCVVDGFGDSLVVIVVLVGDVVIYCYESVSTIIGVGVCIILNDIACFIVSIVYLFCGVCGVLIYFVVEFNVF